MKVELPLLPILPDLLRPGLSLVFCGTAAGPVSAAKGHYYAHPQNKFWKTLFNVGLTPRPVAPADFRNLWEWDIGLTDIAKYASGLDKDLPPTSLNRLACNALKGRISVFSPRILAFTSLNAGRRVFGNKVKLGEQPFQIGATRIWTLPSPSPLAHWNWDQTWWENLAAACKEHQGGPA